VRILIDISHPAHVHFFRHAISLWQEHGHDVRVVAREKDMACDLLNRFNIPFKVLSKARIGLLGWAREMAVHTTRLLPLVLGFRPHLMLQIGGTFIAPVGWLTRTPTWAFTDTENATLSNAVTFPLVHRVFTPACYKLNHGAKHRRFPGFHELAYLHPRRFSPDPSVLSPLGLKPGEPFFIVRFVAWQSAHDIDQKGLGAQDKLELVNALSQHGRVFVSSESPLPEALADYTSQIPIDQIHHFIAHAALVVGESATMASEAAVLGTPAVFISDTGRGYSDVQEHEYGLVFNLSGEDQAEALTLVKDLMGTPHPKDHWQRKRRQLLDDTIDVTGWLVELVEHFGETGDPEAAERWAFGQVKSEERRAV
jgi:predicted glycosyltransferase